ncbi:oxygen-insensitive NAD(P)H nitroreductase [Acetobacter lambici]|uniref:Oxygen-insensitive NAD(P)H nitroreductase n=1 Tax=Acetobacter lambici TaxID=1332824 RepID=A0ABT1F471_9PROT|nr:oxygen-insensitive NAD(P)H nitroreductase [Acetobacter lambici]MCP1243922.1 oxygen-insensitive NAD(P)H nitroreductase [Acetobacter lambici]MCP1260000.1 oxygen-insensitive NAD(P)H nitroreductase [Acetobacter lambici]NHO58124.1 oxygen-insensitive NAD(P)H nitroreductase [Acetobacter lambici]
MDLLHTLTHRHTTKAYDTERKIPAPVVAQLLEALRYSPSSVNSQPWHFFVADNDAGKAQIAKATSSPFAFNASRVMDASHVIVLSARNTLPPEYLQTLSDQEEADGRYANADARAQAHKGRAGFVGLHEQAGDVPVWTQKQTYIAQGFLLLSAALLGVDATPMEGFDAAILSTELELAEKGLSPAVIVALGYHSDADFNARLPKSRLPEKSIFSHI